MVRRANSAAPAEDQQTLAGRAKTEAVVAGEDGTGGWKCYQRQSLNEPCHVNETDFGLPRRPQNHTTASTHSKMLPAKPLRKTAESRPKLLARPPADQNGPVEIVAALEVGYLQSFGEMLGHANRVGHCGKRGVHRPDAH